MVIGIIGGGASGMMAALTAAKNPNAQVLVFERQARVGRKLRATGNGRCNLTNLAAGEKDYHGEDPAFATAALNKLGPKATMELFRKLGLFTTIEESGKVYPYSDHANSVVDVLRFALEKPNVTVHTAFEVEKVRQEGSGFTVLGNDQSIFCDKLIIACGGLAGSKLGGTMAGYKLLSKFGHKSTKLRPSLVQLKSAWSGVASLKGIRTNCHVAILQDGEIFAESVGELQFTDYGLSGPVIFEVSRDVCYGGGCWTARLDMLPDCTGEDLFRELRGRTVETDQLLVGILHNQLGRVLTRTAGVGAKNAQSLTDGEIWDVVKAVKGLEVSLTEPMGMENAQVTAGGVLTRDFDPETMESNLVPNLYACGEVLDIDGDCGGFNLQWAWSSGYLVGLNAGKERV